jgi:adenosylcobinamide-phosphate synthase
MLGVPGNPKGTVSANVDETLNFAPARIGSFLLLLSALVLGWKVKKGFEIFRRDRNKTLSRNSGQTMSVMAGVLGVGLRKEGAYVLGDPEVALSPRFIYDALKIVDVQVTIFVLLMVIYWIL